MTANMAVSAANSNSKRVSLTPTLTGAVQHNPVHIIIIISIIRLIQISIITLITLIILIIDIVIMQ